MLNAEQAEVLGLFMDMLKLPTGDGGIKRAAGLKPCWKDDTSHEAAIFSHLNKWKHGEKKDATSGAHPLVHLAWRALAIAWQESQVQPNYDSEGYYAKQTLPPPGCPTTRIALYGDDVLPKFPVNKSPFNRAISSEDDDVADALSAIADAGDVQARHKLERERYAKELERRQMMADEERRLANPVIHPDPDALDRAREKLSPERAKNRILD